MINRQQSKKLNIILIDDDDDFRHALTQSLKLANYQLQSFARAEEAIANISKNDNTVVITDMRMPEMDGLTCLNRILKIDPAIPVILITGHGNISGAVETMRAGAYDFIEKPFAIERLTSMIDNASIKRQLTLENRSLRLELTDKKTLNSNIIGNSESMQKVRAQVKAIASTPVDILITGETGSGKEVISKALHDEGDRAGKPFVAINCGAIPVEMMESELFGHEAGAFTSAYKKRIGKLEHADGGTVFLDEIESMPMDLQIKLLRVIETRSFEPLGSNKSVSIDVRFIAATKVDLAKASKDKEFRLDLYYRLNVVTINIPPLRERKEDIPELSQHFMYAFEIRYDKTFPQFSDEHVISFNNYDWPGNVRELRNMIDRIGLGMWSGLDEDNNMHNSKLTSNDTGSSKKLLQDHIGQYEAILIKKELEQNNGNMKKTYESLGISRKSLYDKIQKHGLSNSNKKINNE